MGSCPDTDIDPKNKRKKKTKIDVSAPHSILRVGHLTPRVPRGAIASIFFHQFFFYSRDRLHRKARIARSLSPINFPFKECDVLT